MRNPVTRACPLTTVPGYHVMCIKKCAMHMLNLGLGALINGNILVALLEQGFFGDPANLPVESRLYLAWNDLKSFCRDEGIPCSQAPFKPNMAGCKGPNSVPELDTKAYNGRVISAWLAVCFAAAQPQNPDRERVLMETAIWGLATLYQRIEESPRYLTPAQSESIYQCGMAMIQSYSALNAAAMRTRRPRWILKPKIHKVHHLLRDLRRNRAAPSCNLFSGRQPLPIFVFIW